MVASEKIKVLIAEDDGPTRAYLEKLVKEFEGVELVASVADGMEAYEAVRKYNPDLLILDIEMPVMNAFELLEKLDEPIPVVFVTAYDEYAIRAFEINAIDYVLKPVQKERLNMAIKRAIERISEPDEWRSNLQDLIDKFSTKGVVKLPIVTSKSIKLIPLGDIVWIEARGDSSIAHLIDGSEGRVPKRIGEIEKMLPQSSFLRVHKSFIVNLTHISEIVPWFNGEYLLRMVDGSEVIVARRRVKKLKSKFGLTKVEE